MSNETTPEDLIRDLGLRDSVSPLVNLALANPYSPLILEHIIELAMAIGAGGLASYQSRRQIHASVSFSADEIITPWSSRL